MKFSLPSILTATGVLCLCAAAAVSASGQEAPAAEKQAVKLDLSLDIMGFTINGDTLARSGYDWADNTFIRNVPVLFFASRLFLPVCIRHIRYPVKVSRK